MELGVVTELLKRTLDPANRSAAETELSKMQKIIGFCPLILQVVTIRDHNFQTRIISSHSSVI